jgi:flagellar hook-basal body complex protein FliE
MNINPALMKPIDPDLGLGSLQGGEGMGAINAPGAPAKGGGFLEALEKSMESVNTDQLQADNSIKDIVAGKSKNIHETMLQLQKADLSLKTMMQVRNKILEAYKEIMRMQV